MSLPQSLRTWAAAPALVVSLGALALPTAAQAQALFITGGVTSVTLTAAPVLVGAGLGVAPLGTATVSPGSTGIPLAYFPVTGGTIDTVTFAGLIEHEGSGLALSNATTTVNLTNFLINTTSLVLTGDVMVGSTSLADVPLFNIGFSGVATSPFSLSVTATAAGALTAFLGLPDLTGAVLGTANTIPITSAVPEPETWAAMIGGLALVGAALRRRRALN
jgi:hypothetical protein